MKKDNDSFPSFFEQVKNLSSLASNVAKDVVEGKKMLSSKKVQDERWDICDTCYHNCGGRCAICGCQIGTKVKFAASRCPLMKWNENYDAES